VSTADLIGFDVEISRVGVDTYWCAAVQQGKSRVDLGPIHIEPDRTFSGRLSKEGDRLLAGHHRAVWARVTGRIVASRRSS
jgi:hypothetical protein